MNAERAASYGMVMRTLAEIGPAKLHASETSRIRDAADTLLFTDGHTAESTAALLDVMALVNTLRDSDRWTEEAAEGLLSDVAACGPAAVAASRRAAVYA